MTTVKWLKLQFDQEDIDPIVDLLKSGNTICGFSEVVDNFEEEMEKYVGVKYALACANGTVAIFVACEALQYLFGKKFNYGVPTWSYIAPANVADYVGKLTLVDSEKNTHNINVDEIDMNEINALIPVDMAGVPVDYKKIKSLDIPVIADNAESLGAKYDGKHVSSISLVSTTSFQDAKIITTGEGGMIFTNDSEIAKICKLIINQGYGPSGYDTHEHVFKGFNFRMCGIQAALGIAQLSKLSNLIRKRKKIASIYFEKLKGLVDFPKYSDNVEPNYYSFLIMFNNKTLRDSLKKFLSEKMVQCKLWKPIHLYDIYNSGKKYPTAEYIYDHHLRLPIHNNLSEEQAEIVCFHIKEGLEVLLN